MARSMNHWADNYVERRRTAQEAISMVRSGQRVFIGSSCGEPQHLVKSLSEAADRFSDLEIVRLLSLESAPLTMLANKTGRQALDIRSFYLGSARPEVIDVNRRFVTPMNLSAIPRLFRTRRMPINVALIQVSPPDDFGWMSLGVSVDITLAAAWSADLVIAQVNGRMPRVLGRSVVHVNEVDVIVAHDEPLLTVPDLPESERANRIGRLIARLIDDGSTIQISPGTTPRATLLALESRRDLGVHTQFITNEIMQLYAKGVITNRKKGFNEGKLVASTAIGSEYLYEFINDNPAIEFYPSDYVNDSGNIARNHKMVSLNVASVMDLTGQVGADALPQNQFSGVSGMLDFIRGAARSEDGKSILLLLSTADRGRVSRIVPELDDTAVVVPRGDVHYVATEYGVVNLFGKSLQERALAMISIAHPDFRESLFDAAKERGLLGKRRILTDCVRGVYPLKYEEIVTIDGEKVVIRPAKPVDERRIQEHFYNLDKEDVVARFFYEKSSFVREEIEELSQIDYVRNLTMLAVVGEFGFGQVVALGEYLLDPETDLAEVAFSVSRPWQGKGLGKRLLEKLAQAARENGISGLMAYTSPTNRGMIRLFKTLPYRIETQVDGDVVVLRCWFEAVRGGDGPENPAGGGDTSGGEPGRTEAER